MAKHCDFGKRGEDFAAKYLIERGYHICCRNYRFRKAEIDIVARKADTLVIVEVKTRRAAFYAELSDAVSKKKIRLLVQATDQYISEQQLDLEVRFDIIALVEKGGTFELVHLEDAFYHF